MRRWTAPNCSTPGTPAARGCSSRSRTTTPTCSFRERWYRGGVAPGTLDVCAPAPDFRRTSPGSPDAKPGREREGVGAPATRQAQEAAGRQQAIPQTAGRQADHCHESAAELRRETRKLQAIEGNDPIIRRSTRSVADHSGGPELVLRRPETGSGSSAHQSRAPWAVAASVPTGDLFPSLPARPSTM